MVASCGNFVSRTTNLPSRFLCGIKCSFQGMELKDFMFEVNFSLISDSKQFSINLLVAIARDDN